MSMMHAALAWSATGCSVIPIAANGTKRPMIKWESNIIDAATEKEIRTWYTQWPTAGIGIVCGHVSGNLEMLELEGRATSGEHLDRVVAACDERGITWLWNQLTQQGYAEWTPSGGIHLIYSIADHLVPGNTKIAQDKDRLCLAETRGEGGYVVVAPSGGSVHKSGEPWTVAAGEIGIIPMVDWEDRCTLHEAIKAALDETPPAPVVQRKPIMAPRPSQGVLPGEDFNQRASWHDILEPHGWKAVSQKGVEVFWLHPHSTSGAEHSASTNMDGNDRLYVWSTSTPFPAQEPVNKFFAYTILEHGGNFSASVKDLSAKGYGTPLERTAPSAAHLLLDSAQAMETSPVDLGAPGQAVPHTEAGHPSTPVGWREDFPAPQLTPQDFLDEEFTLQGAGNLFAKGYENAFKYCEDTKKWWFWSGKVWRLDGRARHEQATKELINVGRKAANAANLSGEDYSKPLTRHINKMANAQAPNVHRWARSDQRIGIDCEQLDAIGHMVTVGNGILDLESHTLMPHDPQMLLTRQIPVTYDKDALAPKWEMFLAQALPDPEIRAYLQKAIGHTMLGNAEQRALFLLHGPSGTGKSQFIRVMELLFGDFAETATAATFNASSKTATLTNDLNDLRGKRFVSLSELDEGEVLNESLVKRLTGGDTAKSRGLWQENSKWRVEFSMWLATNNLPRLNSDDNAIWRRVKPIEFGQVAAANGGEILRLAEKIFAEEASGILNWVLEGVRMYQQDGLADLDQITEAVNAYRREVDVVEQFIAQASDDKQIAVGEGQEIASSRLYAIFTEWCHANGMRNVFGTRRFAQRMERMGFEKKKTMAANVWVGIGTGNMGLLGTMDYPRRT